MATFSAAALTAASASYWVLKWVSPPPSLMAALAPSTLAPPDSQAVARVLGGGQNATAGETPDTLASHFNLSGVVAERAPEGYALIAVDEQPAKPFHVGDLVGEGLVLHSVTPHSASLAPQRDAPVSLTLEMPEIPEIPEN